MKKFDVVEWMAEHGHPGYKSEIEHITNSDRSAAEKVALIEEIYQEAYDRYDDWRTDPLD